MEDTALYYVSICFRVTNDMVVSTNCFLLGLENDDIVISKSFKI
jgi:hypothetical protein